MENDNNSFGVYVLREADDAKGKLRWGDAVARYTDRSEAERVKKELEGLGERVVISPDPPLPDPGILGAVRRGVKSLR